jgi:hypothetical protein
MRRGVVDDEGRQAAQLARVALIVSAIALAIAILGLFLPIG